MLYTFVVLAAAFLIARFGYSMAESETMPIAILLFLIVCLIGGIG